MSRLGACFEALQKKQRKALIPYITAGDPHPDHSVGLMHAMVAAGADILELGVPFSDPMADGPVIQRASERALLHHVGLGNIFDMLREFREKDSVTPVVLMGYLNPIEVKGYALFAQQAAEAGVDGILTVDIPPEEAAEYLQALESQKLDPIFLLSPTSKADRMAKICALAKGFIYYVSLKGVTGSSQLDIHAVEQKLELIRSISDLPVGVGFGISDADSAAAVAHFADAVVVGSALIKLIEVAQGDQEKILASVTQLVQEMRQAMDNV